MGAILCSHVFSENDLRFPQRSPGEANGNLSSPQFHPAYGQAISQAAIQALCEAKARPSNKLNKTSQGMKYWAIRFFLPCSS